MRLQELLESTEEDRALISLAANIFKMLSRYANQDLDFEDEEDEIIRLGSIGYHFDTPLQGFDKIKIEIHSDSNLLDAINRRRKERKETPIFNAPKGMWAPATNTIVFNSDYLSHSGMKSVVTHELRHALDDIKSEYRVANSEKYSTPKNKTHRKKKNDPYSDKDPSYDAQPAEINARFVQVLDNLVSSVSKVAHLPFDKARNSLHKALMDIMDKHNISYLFPQREKSPDWKRLMKRGADFIDKELRHAQSKIK